MPDSRIGRQDLRNGKCSCTALKMLFNISALFSSSGKLGLYDVFIHFARFFEVVNIWMHYDFPVLESTILANLMPSAKYTIFIVSRFKVISVTCK